MSESESQRRIGAAPIVAIVVGFLVVGALFLGLLGFFFLGVRASPPAVVTSSPAAAPAVAPAEVQDEAPSTDAEGDEAER
jgi:hypothetical protein